MGVVKVKQNRTRGLANKLSEKGITWEVSLISRGKHIKKTITLGRASNKYDVKQALKRQGVAGEILSIRRK